MRHLAVVELLTEEFEAMQLKNLQNLDQTAVAAQMQTSQSTVQRILDSAYHKVAEALVEGKAIRIIEP